MELYSSYSPCINCCKLIEQFLHLRPQCKISITFTCVYKDYDQQHRSALSGLWKNPSVIRLDVFREEEWKVLQDNELVDLTPEQYILMRYWDEYWRNILDDILGWSIMVEELWVSHIWIVNEVFYSRCVECSCSYSGPQAYLGRTAAWWLIVLAVYDILTFAARCLSASYAMRELQAAKGVSVCGRETRPIILSRDADFHHTF